jgi:hypothetical protein
MRRPNNKSRNVTFYEPKTVATNAGLVDRYGRIYVVQPSGALRLIKDIVTGPDDPRRNIK